jgi:GT2 family glycosyltransferase
MSRIRPPLEIPMSNVLDIAVLLTCYNRRETTLRCLGSLFSAACPDHWRLHVWLVDDGSKDGTADAVREGFPQVRVLQGTGSLYWCGGMRSAWAAAECSHPDAFLWLNDDVVLHPDALAVFASHLRQNAEAIWIASCKSPSTGGHSYGGRVREGCHPARSRALLPDASAPLVCDTFQGNLVLVPQAVVSRIGRLTDFQHAMADTDYGLRATRAGIPCMLLPGYVANCESNPNDGKHHDASVPRLTRLKSMMGLKGLPPRDWWKFCRIHGGLLAPAYFLSPYLRVLFR